MGVLKNMSIMEPCGFNCEDIIINLKKDSWIENSTRRRLLDEMRVIVQFVFSKAIQDCMEEFNKRFISKVGNVAYNRTMLLGIYFYCFKRGDSTLKEMSERCVSDDILKIFTCNLTPSNATLRRFLEDEIHCFEFRKIFLYTLVKLNDFDLLAFLYAFIDGTDAIVKASKHYKITRDQLKALKLFAKWDILLKNKTMETNYWEMKVNEKKSNIHDEETLELIEIAENNPKLFTKANAKKIPDFEEAFEQTTKDYISIMFPKSIMMPTKKGGFDFALNLQSILTEHKIIIGELLLKKNQMTITVLMK
jgi:predicted MPP superfamily phosphohydrolase